MFVRTSKMWWRAAIVAVLAVLAALVGNAAAIATGTPTLTADKADYAPGSQVTLTGDGWAPGEVIDIYVNDTSSNSWSLTSGVNGAPAAPVADAGGGFTYQFLLPSWFVSDYTASATGSLSGTAATSFTDGAVQRFDQCSNDTGNGYSTGDTGCRWIHGNLQQSNSVYNEGDATVQRVALDGMVAGQSYTLLFTYQTSKQGTHAYDYLTTYDYSETFTTNAQADLCQQITGGCAIAGASTYPIPNDPNVVEDGVQQFTMSGGTLTNASGTFTNSFAGDTTNTMSVTFTATGPTSVLWFGAHVASQVDWGAGNGAGSISGSPYHVSLASLNGASIGSQDNQMASNAVQANGSITIVKDAVPNDAQDFSFRLTRVSTGSDTDFALDDDADATLSNTRTFSAAPGSWTASELTLPAGWTLANLVCTNAAGNTSSVTRPAATITVVSGGSTTCTFTNTKTTYANLTVTKTATPSFDRTYAWTVTKSVDDTRIEIAEGGAATFNYSVVADKSDPIDSGWKVDGVITVTNPNAVAISGVDVTDSLPGATCAVVGGTGQTIPANGSRTFTYSCSYAAAPVAGSNTATATWTAGAPYGTTGSASGSAAVDFVGVTPATTNDSVTVIDDKTNPAAPVALGTTSADHTYTYSLTKPGVAGQCTTYTNTAVVKNGTTTLDSDSVGAEVCVGSNLTVSKTAVASYGSLYPWNISKTAPSTQTVPAGSTATIDYQVTVTPGAEVMSGWHMVGVITVANPNRWESIDTTITDTVNLGGGATCAADTSTLVVPAATAAGPGVATVGYTCSFTSKPALTGTNAATATWDAAAAFTPSGTATGSTGVTFTQTSSSGATITVTDTMNGQSTNLGTFTWSEGPKTVTVTKTVTAPSGTCAAYLNTATIDQTGQSDQASATVCGAVDLGVEKTAAGTYVRDFDWTIAKSVDKTTIAINEGGTATFNYTVVATPTGSTDSGWVVEGDITVHNPNDFTDVSVDLTDNLGAGCTVTPSTVTVPRSGDSAPAHYTCTIASKPANTGMTNTATATWSLADLPTTQGTGTDSAASGAVDVGWSARDLVDDTVVVVDDKTDPSNPITLGEASVTDPRSHTFTYAVDKAGVAGTCTTYTNTAILTSSDGDQSDDQDVQVCVTAALTATKTATATYDVDYDWTLAKDVDRTRAEIGSGSADFHYTVTATPSAPKLSGYELHGSVTVNNPNDWAVDATVSDVPGVGGDATCTLTYPGGGASASVPAHQSAVVGYSCTFGGVPAASGENVATVTWDGGSTTATAAIDFAVDTTTDASVDVYDDLASATSTKLGTAYAQDGATDYPYTLNFPGVAGTCTDHTNTASVPSQDLTADKTVTVCKGKDLTIVKSAVGGKAREYHWTIDKEASATTVHVDGTGSATWTYTVVVGQDGYSDSSHTLAGRITVHNPNDWGAPISALVTDVPTIQGVTCVLDDAAQVSVAAGEDAYVDYHCDFAGTVGSSGTNTATATWDAALAHTPTGSVATTVPVSIPVTGEKNRTITVTDPMAPAGTFTPIAYDTADPGRTTTFTYSVTKPGVPGTCYDVDNTATITQTGGKDSAKVTLCSTAAPTVEKDVTSSYEVLHPWKVTKTVDHSTLSGPAGTPLTFNYTVTATPLAAVDRDWRMSGGVTITNTNAWEMTYVVDDGLAACSMDGGPTVTLAAGETRRVTYTCVFGAKPAYTGTNTATVTWAPQTGITAGGQASDDAAYTFGVRSEIDTTVTVRDDKTDPANPVDLGTAVWNAAGTPAVFGPYAVSQTAPIGRCAPFTNTAWAVTEGSDPSDSVTVQACGGVDLTAEKTVDGTYTRSYKWLIDKVVNGATQVNSFGSTATFTYAVTVTPNGYVDSNWLMTGVVKVANPNNWPVGGITVTDVPGVGGGAVCTITYPNGRIVPANGFLEVAYSCTFATKPVYEGTNVATVVWDQGAAHSPSGSTTAEQAFLFTRSNDASRSVTVTDDLAGTAPVKSLGTVDWTRGITSIAPGVSGNISGWTFSYATTFPVAAGCKDFTNTAKLSTGQSDQASVRVCGPANIGDGTIGFWQNKNGLAVIKGGKFTPTTKPSGVVVNVCNVTPWLRQFSPFADLNQYATCAQVATYVTNVIKAANASGSSMNAMLKAQMLASALNLYYTTNEPRRGAPAGPLGSMVFDISSWSGAFGGATEMTLMQMLQYASSKNGTPGGMTDWYAQVKATQELAKNAFQAVNMSKIFVVRTI